MAALGKLSASPACPACGVLLPLDFTTTPGEDRSGAWVINLAVTPESADALRAHLATHMHEVTP